MGTLDVPRHLLKLESPRPVTMHGWSGAHQLRVSSTQLITPPALRIAHSKSSGSVHGNQVVDTRPIAAHALVQDCPCEPERCESMAIGTRRQTHDSTTTTRLHDYTTTRLTACHRSTYSGAKDFVEVHVTVCVAEAEPANTCCSSTGVHRRVAAAASVGTSRVRDKVPVSSTHAHARTHTRTHARTHAPQRCPETLAVTSIARARNYGWLILCEARHLGLCARDRSLAEVRADLLRRQRQLRATPIATFRAHGGARLALLMHEQQPRQRILGRETDGRASVQY